MTESHELSASLEDYLEAIYHIVERKQAARAKDIADRLQVSRSSVTGALRGLSKRGLINYAPYDIVTLTDQGRALAADVVHRHQVLRDFFTKILLLDEEEAEKVACQVEHDVTPLLVEGLVRFLGFIERCPRTGPGWLAGYSEHGGDHVEDGDCEECLSRCLERYRRQIRGKPDQSEPAAE